MIVAATTSTSESPAIPQVPEADRSGVRFLLEGDP